MTNARLGIIAFALCCLAGACVGIYDAISAYNARYRSEAKMRLYQPLAENGNPDAQFELGVMYHSGFGAVPVGNSILLATDIESAMLLPYARGL
jgi:hypothetical protein